MKGKTETIDINEQYRIGEISAMKHASEMHRIKLEEINGDKKLADAHVDAIKDEITDTMNEIQKATGEDYKDFLYDKADKLRDPKEYKDSLMKPKPTVKGEKPTVAQEAYNKALEGESKLIPQIISLEAKLDFSSGRRITRPPEIPFPT